jgi:hypothetical protein
VQGRRATAGEGMGWPSAREKVKAGRPGYPPREGGGAGPPARAPRALRLSDAGGSSSAAICAGAGGPDGVALVSVGGAGSPVGVSYPLASPQTTQTVTSALAGGGFGTSGR